MSQPKTMTDIQQRLESIDAVPSESVPAGWSRRNWVQREAVAFGAIGDESLPRLEPAAK
jgi:hypothetical protein